MTNEEIIQELNCIASQAELLKDRAERLRRKLVRVDGPASRKRVQVKIDKVLARRRLNKIK